MAIVFVCFVLFFVCVYLRLRIQLSFSTSKVNCGSAVRHGLGQALATYLITAHHVYAFLLYLDC